MDLNHIKFVDCETVNKLYDYLKQKNNQDYVLYLDGLINTIELINYQII